MSAGPFPLPYRASLTNRLPRAHPGLKRLRETPATPPAPPAGRAPPHVTQTPPPSPLRAALRAFVVVLALTTALAVAAPAMAASACGKQVIDDWYDNGRVDGSYDLSCYDDAIDALPRDVKDYSSAAEDITRALQAAMVGKPAPAATSDPSPDGGTTTPPGDDPEDPDDGEGGTSKPGDDGENVAGPGDVDTASSDSDSIPIPLLVLAGLALLLIAAGSIGYVTRRHQARRLPPPPSA